MVLRIGSLWFAPRCRPFVHAFTTFLRLCNSSCVFDGALRVFSVEVPLWFWVVQFAASVSLQKAYAWRSVTDAMRAANLGL